MANTYEVIEDILEHHGVKGMKWGVRRKATVGAQEVIVKDTRRKIPGFEPKVKTKGGGGRPASPDAVRAATTRQIGKKSGVKALSDQQLQEYTRRMNLEQQVKRLQYEQSNPAKKFILKLTGQAGKTAMQDAANQYASQQVKKRLVKAAVLTAQYNGPL